VNSMGIKETGFAPSRFLTSFARLIAPMQEDEFRASYFEKKLLLLHRGDPDFYGDLFSIRDFDRALATSPDYVQTAEAKTNTNTKNEGNTASGLESALGEFRKGGTLVLDGVHKREAKLGLLCRVLEQELGHYFQTNIYLTPPNGQGFNPHYDSHDVFVLQISGSKHWKVEKERRVFPGKRDLMGKDGREFLAPYDSFTLQKGDMVYIPRGYVHAAECGSEPSLHITLGLVPTTWDDLLHAVVKAIVQSDPRLNEALPLGYLRGPGDDLVKGLVALRRKLGDEAFLNGVVDRYRDELVTKFPLDVSGVVETLCQPLNLKPDDVVGPRPGSVYRVSCDDEAVRIVFGARTVTFPGFLREPVAFALNTSVYEVRDITGGELEDEEKVIFAARLMEEGLVVRK